MSLSSCFEIVINGFTGCAATILLALEVACSLRAAEVEDERLSS